LDILSKRSFGFAWWGLCIGSFALFIYGGEMCNKKFVLSIFLP
jgi:hypothetical protein